MAGTTGLEPATSAVTVLHSEAFQRLTNLWGTPKALEVVQVGTFCGSDCGSEIESTNDGRTVPLRAGITRSEPHCLRPRAR
jgi:hypothetical protein